MRFPILIGGALALILGTSIAVAFDYRTDPPAGSIRCGQRVTVKSSKACGGKSATIIGGCDIGSSGRQTSGARRQVFCGKSHRAIHERASSVVGAPVATACNRANRGSLFRHLLE